MTDINKAVRTLLRTLWAMPANSVRPADQVAPTGTVGDQFATVRIISEQATGGDEMRYANVSNSNNVTETVIGQRLFTASVNVYRGDAYTKVRRLAALLSTTTAIQLMQSQGIGLVRVSPARNLTTMIDSEFEQRGQIDLEFHVVESEANTLATYGTFNIELHTADKDGTDETYLIEVNEP